MSQEQLDKNWVDASASVAPTVLGVAAGVILADSINSESRRPVAFVLATIGACALVPSIVEFVADKLVGPESRHGSQKTLRRIRDNGVGGTQIPDMDDEDAYIV